MSISHYQLADFLDQHKGKGFHAKIEELDEGCSLVELFDDDTNIAWMESDASVLALIEYLTELGYEYKYYEDELELPSDMVERLDEIDNAVYQLILTLAEKTEDELEWNMGIIGGVTDAVKNVLAKYKIPVHHPAIATDKDGSQEIVEYDEFPNKDATKVGLKRAIKKKFYIAVTCFECNIHILGVEDTHESALMLVGDDIVNTFQCSYDELTAIQKICDAEDFDGDLESNNIDFCFRGDGSGYGERLGNNISWDIFKGTILLDAN